MITLFSIVTSTVTWRESFPAVEVISRAAVLLMSAAAEKLGLAPDGEGAKDLDEAQVRVAIDLSGRAFGVFEGKFAREAVGGLPTELVPHFFKSLAESGWTRGEIGRGTMHNPVWLTRED